MKGGFMIPLEAQAYLDRGAVVELEESRWVIIDVNHLDSDVYVLMEWGPPTICGSEPQRIARNLYSKMSSGELATRPLNSVF